MNVKRLTAASSLGILMALMARAEVNVYVSPSGSDQASGTRRKPFRTLDRARDEVRKVLKAGGSRQSQITVWLKGGTYVLSGSFGLTVMDSGRPGLPVRYKPLLGEHPVISGGRSVLSWRRLPAGEAPDIPVRDRIVVADLAGQDFPDLADIAPNGFGRGVEESGSELFCQGKPMTLARWPNVGWTYTDFGAKEPAPDRFLFSEDRVGTWAGLPDVWFHGYWGREWADFVEKAGAIDIPRHEVTVTQPPGRYGFSPGGRFYGFNELRELDSSGEYYIDRTLKRVYFWPPDGDQTRDCQISTVREPLIHISEASNISLAGLTISYGRGSGVFVEGGESVVVDGCLLECLGGDAVIIRGGLQHAIRNSVIAFVGGGGIALAGGDRQTLRPSGHVAENNHIHHYERLNRTLHAGISVSGVGNRASHNVIHDAPHQGIAISGNDNVIELNEVFRVGLETSDAGAIYMGRDWTMRGNRISGNYIHDLGSGDITGVYLDDLASGSTVENNILDRMPLAVLVGGGRDNTIRHNLFLDVGTAIHVDARGRTLQKMQSIDFQQLLDSYRRMQADRPPFSSRYPRLQDLLTNHPEAPLGNEITGNVYTLSNWLHLRGLESGEAKIENNVLCPGLRANPGTRTLTGDRACTAQFDSFSSVLKGGGALLREQPSCVSVREAAAVPPSPPVRGQSPLRFSLLNCGAAVTAGVIHLWVYPRSGTTVTPANISYRLAPSAMQLVDVVVRYTGQGKNILLGYQESGSDIAPIPVRVPTLP